MYTYKYGDYIHVHIYMIYNTYIHGIIIGIRSNGSESTSMAQTGIRWNFLKDLRRGIGLERFTGVFPRKKRQTAMACGDGSWWNPEIGLAVLTWFNINIHEPRLWMKTTVPQSRSFAGTFFSQRSFRSGSCYLTTDFCWAVEHLGHRNIQQWPDTSKVCHRS